MAAEPHDLEQLLHGFPKPPLAGEHARELDARVVVERVDAELLAELGLAGSVGPRLRERNASLERADALGDGDVARHGSEQLRRSVDVAGREGCLGGAQRFLAGGRHELPEELANLRFGNRAHELCDGTPVLERDDVGNRADIERLRQVGVLVGIDLDELDAAAEVFRDLVERRAERAARAAPRRPEVDDDGDRFRGFDDLALEGDCGDVHVRHCTAGPAQAVAVVAGFWQATRMSSHDHRSGSRARLLTLGAIGVALLGGAASWLLLGGRVGGDSTSEVSEPAPIGYAPSAPAGGSVLRYEQEYPTIPYTTGKRTDRVAALIDRIERGEAKLTHDGGARGYLESLLAALEIDPSSQTLVYSQTSLQSKLIGPKTPRAIYFNDDVYVGYVQDGPIEIASLDPSLGPVFYLLEQSTGSPAFGAE